jgi:hypothetical protein
VGLAVGVSGKLHVGSSTDRGTRTFPSPSVGDTTRFQVGGAGGKADQARIRELYMLQFLQHIPHSAHRGGNNFEFIASVFNYFA